MILKNLLIILIPFLTNVINQTTEYTNYSWVKLSKINNELIIYNSCDQGNLIIDVNENQHITLLGVQEEEIFDILKIEKNEILTSYYTKSQITKSVQVFNFRWIDKRKGTCEWSTTFSNGYYLNETFVNQKQKTNFKEYHQPCSDCWGKECE